ncbi:MAG: hypothetical protein AB1505_01175 [Candidatus Latescibacterota bacterium]
MREPMARLLFVIGMLVSFPAILAVMVVVGGPLPPQPQPRRARPPAAQQGLASRPVPPPGSVRPTSRPSAPAGTRGRQAAVPAPPAAAAARSGATAVAGPAASELTALKGELHREITSLKENRDAMIAALAQSLAGLPPARSAAQLAGMDAEVAARTLSHFGDSLRQQVLARMPAAQARQVRSKLELLAAR